MDLNSLQGLSILHGVTVQNTQAAHDAKFYLHQNARTENLSVLQSNGTAKARQVIQVVLK